MLIPVFQGARLETKDGVIIGPVRWRIGDDKNSFTLGYGEEGFLHHDMGFASLADCESAIAALAEAGITEDVQAFGLTDTEFRDICLSRLKW